jgi:negative regulator of flagellin synthesis FlgM
MKINNFGPSGVNPYKRQINKLENTGKPAKTPSDKIEISSTAKEMQQVSQLSENRKAKVEALKIQVENGTYKMNPKEVAKSIASFYSKK